MFSKLVFFLVAFFGLLAAAAPQSISQCNTGNAVCCNTVQSASDPVTSILSGLLGIVLGAVTGQVGLGCTPITVVGLGQGANCAQQPVCCQNVQINGLVGVGCTPISL